MIWIICGAVVWAVCGVLAYGLNFAYYQYQFPLLAKEKYAEDKADSIQWALGGPISLLAAVLAKQVGHGFKWK